jgi:hypothetical protein
VRSKAFGAQNTLDRRAADLHTCTCEKRVRDRLLGPYLPKRGGVTLGAAACQSHDLTSCLQRDLRRSPSARGVQERFETRALAPARAPLVDGADGAVELPGHGSRAVAIREQQDHPDALDQPMWRAGPTNARKEALSLVARYLHGTATTPHVALRTPASEN